MADDAFAAPEHVSTSWPSQIFGALTVLEAAIVGSVGAMTTSAELLLGSGLGAANAGLFTLVALAGIPAGLLTIARPAHARLALGAYAAAVIGAELLSTLVHMATHGATLIGLLSALPLLVWPTMLLMAVPFLDGPGGVKP